MKSKKTRRSPEVSHGPEPETVFIEGMDWEAALGKALSKRRPETGWPDRAVKRRKKRRRKSKR